MSQPIHLQPVPLGKSTVLLGVTFNDQKIGIMKIGLAFCVHIYTHTAGMIFEIMFYF